MASEWYDRPVEKLLPQSVDAERCVLGCLIIDPDCAPEVLTTVRSEDFYREAHRVIYAAIADLWRAHTPADLITLCDHLERRGRLEDIGGSPVVSALTSAVPTAANAAHYAQIVARTALARRIIHAAGQIAGLAYGDLDSDFLASEAQRLLSEALASRLGGDSAPFAEVADDLLAEQIAAREAGASGMGGGVMFGLTALDAALTGVKPGEVVMVAGRPGSGKSAFAATVAEWAADRLAEAGRGGTVEYITLEMRAQQVVGRLLAAHARIDTRLLRANFLRVDGSFDQPAWAALRAAASAAVERRGQALRFLARPVRAADVRLHLERAVAQRDCRFAVLDYIGLVRPDDDAASRQTEYQRISNLSREIKQLALTLNIPIMCLVQMSRESERRANPRPQPSDLRDSGQLEQDADIIIGLYRGAAYMPRMAEADERFSQFAEALLLKVRDGAPNITVPLRFEGPYARFSDWPRDWDYRRYLTYTPSDEPTASGLAAPERED